MQENTQRCLKTVGVLVVTIVVCKGDLLEGFVRFHLHSFRKAVMSSQCRLELSAWSSQTCLHSITHTQTHAGGVFDADEGRANIDLHREIEGQLCQSPFVVEA